LEKIGWVLKKFFIELGIERPVLKYQALFIWHEVVVRKISNVTEPKRISGNRLFVRVLNDAWRNELVFYKKDIINRLNERLGSEIIEEIILL
jgi:hypothetical protein